MGLFGAWYLFSPAGSLLSPPATGIANPIGFAVLCTALIVLTEVNHGVQSRLLHRSRLLDLANDAVIELDLESDTVKYWNHGAVKLYGWTKTEALGQHLPTLLQSRYQPSVHQQKAQLLQDGNWEGELVHTRQDGSQVPVASRWTLQKNSNGAPVGYMQINRNISRRNAAEQELRGAYAELEHRVKERTAALQEANQELHKLSLHLLRVRDDERRRIARELHDSAGQQLSAIAMAVAAVQQPLNTASPALQNKLKNIAEMARACASEIRTISLLLHPPLLEELGFFSAARDYVHEFGNRSGIQAELVILDEIKPLGEDIELTLFRILQECLTNIHRHSNSKAAVVTIGLKSDRLWLEVRDEGSGKAAGPFRPGVGIAGMRERVAGLGGVLEIVSDEAGTCVKATVPLAPEPPRVEVSSKESARAAV